MCSHPHLCACLGNVQKLWATRKVQEASSRLRAPSEHEMGPRCFSQGPEGPGPQAAGLWGQARESIKITAGASSTYGLCASPRPALLQAGEGRGWGIRGKLAGKSDIHSLWGWELWPEGLTGVTRSLGEPRPAHRWTEPSAPEEHGAEQIRPPRVNPWPTSFLAIWPGPGAWP